METNFFFSIARERESVVIRLPRTGLNGSRGVSARRGFSGFPLARLKSLIRFFGSPREVSRCSSYAPGENKTAMSFSELREGAGEGGGRGSGGR